MAGAGNVTMVAGLRSLAKAMELPPAPTVRAPALDPTCERLGVKLPGATHPGTRLKCWACTKLNESLAIVHALISAFWLDGVRCDPTLIAIRLNRS